MWVVLLGMHHKTILWGYLVDIVGHSQQYYLSGKPKICLTSKHSRCVLGQKCTSLLAVFALEDLPAPSLRGTRVLGPGAWYSQQVDATGQRVALWNPPACGWTIGYPPAKKDQSNKRRRSKGHRFLWDFEDIASQRFPWPCGRSWRKQSSWRHDSLGGPAGHCQVTELGRDWDHHHHHHHQDEKKYCRNTEQTNRIQ